MQLLKLFILFISFLSSTSFAGYRISGGLGFGSTSSKNESSASEGPFVQSYTVEFILHSRMYLGVEHLRSVSLSPLSTSISFTGLFMRYYLNSSPVLYVNSDNVQTNEIVYRDLTQYIGIGTGFGQSSLPIDLNNDSPNAAGIYISPRWGSEMSLTRKIGARGELMIINTIFGKGTLTSVSLLGSIYYSF